MKNSANVYKSPLWLRYTIPIVAVGVMILLRIALIDWVEGRFPLILFIVPVIIAAWYGGIGPSVLTAILSVVAGASLFKPYNLQIDTSLGFERLAMFSLVCSICIFIITRLHHARHLVEENELKLQQQIVDRQKIEEDLRNEVTIRIRAETALAEALTKAEKASHAKTEFLANMSHEIRTPMNAVVGLTNILAMHAVPPQKQKEILSTLKVSADSLLNLIDDMLDITKIEARSVELEMIPFNLRQIAKDVMTIMTLKANEKKLDLTIEDDDLQHADFNGDPTRVKQIIMNLCSNAIKFTHSGAVSIHLKTAASSEETDEVAISVKDTGTGIPSDKLDTIFEKFVQGDATINRKYGGSGLGLAIVKNLAEIMGGTISVESQYGSGSTFIVRIPLRRSTAMAPSPAPDKFNPHGTVKNRYKTHKILLVEDNPANILVASSFLEQFGFAFDVAANGMEALNRLETGTYSTILMDIQMPDMDGFQVTRIIREKKLYGGQEHLHIIGMTAHALGGDRELCLASGMDDYITKPFDPDQLEKKLRSVSFGKASPEYAKSNTSA